MKVGDKVICILDYYNMNKLIHKKYNMYEVRCVLSSIIFLSCEFPYRSNFGYKKDNFYIHFITLKQYRKQKLEKLNERR